MKVFSHLSFVICHLSFVICYLYWGISMSKADIYTFERKVRFYQNRHQQTANRKIVISPMVHPRAREVASELEVEVYSYAEDLELN